MNLTSDLDYRLTKKRLRMMSKPFSFLRSGLKRFFLIPITASLILLFCTIPEKPAFYPDIKLTPVYDSEIKGTFAAIQKGPDGELFTGIQRHYRSENNQLASEFKYENGVYIEGWDYDSTGTEKGHIVHDYDPEQDLHIATRVYKYGELQSEMIYHTPEGLVILRDWYDSEYMKSEVSMNDSGYQGLMTLYDEQGNIQKQELYENGELIEKIK